MGIKLRSLCSHIKHLLARSVRETWLCCEQHYDMEYVRITFKTLCVLESAIYPAWWIAQKEGVGA